MVSNLKFSTNWNNKLHCKAFTTLRAYDPAKYAIGTKHDIWLADEAGQFVRLGTATVIAHQHRTTDTLTEAEAMLDTGYDLAYTQRILRNLFKRPDHALLTLSYVTLVYTQKA